MLGFVREEEYWIVRRHPALRRLALSLWWVGMAAVGGVIAGPDGYRVLAL